MTSPKNLKDILPSLRPFSKKVTFLVMGKPCGKGAFRQVYYCMDKNTRERFMLKHFHVSRSIDQDTFDAMHISKQYAFSKYVSMLYQDDLSRAQNKLFQSLGRQPNLLDNHIFNINSITFVDCYYSSTNSWFDESNTPIALMIEPLLPDFYKWFNNDITDTYLNRPGSYPHNQALATFLHWTFTRSNQTFIIADLQGMKFCIPHSLTTDDITTLTLKNIEIKDTETTKNDRFLKWLLSDPVVHVLKSLKSDLEFADLIKEEISIEYFDGNLGNLVEDYFYERHVCNEFCRILELPGI